MSRRTTQLATSGMHCGSCAMLIDMTLKDLEGVEEASTSHADGQTSVTYDDEQLSTDELIAAVRSAGYDAEVIG